MKIWNSVCSHFGAKKIMEFSSPKNLVFDSKYETFSGNKIQKFAFFDEKWRFETVCIVMIMSKLHPNYVDLRG